MRIYIAPLQRDLLIGAPSLATQLKKCDFRDF